MRSAILIPLLASLVGVPARAQEALAIGLKGPVHTVLTEEFTSEGGARGEPSGSVLESTTRRVTSLRLTDINPTAPCGYIQSLTARGRSC